MEVQCGSKRTSAPPGKKAARAGCKLAGGPCQRAAEAAGMERARTHNGEVRRGVDGRVDRRRGPLPPGSGARVPDRRLHDAARRGRLCTPSCETAAHTKHEKSRAVTALRFLLLVSRRALLACSAKFLPSARSCCPMVYKLRHSGFRRGAKCCMGAPRGNDFLLASLGTGSLSAWRPHLFSRAVEVPAAAVEGLALAPGALAMVEPASLPAAAGCVTAFKATANSRPSTWNRPPEAEQTDRSITLTWRSFHRATEGQQRTGTWRETGSCPRSGRRPAAGARARERAPAARHPHPIKRQHTLW